MIHPSVEDKNTSRKALDWCGEIVVNLRYLKVPKIHKFEINNNSKKIKVYGISFFTAIDLQTL